MYSLPLHQKPAEAMCCACHSHHLPADINPVSGFLQQVSLIRTLRKHLIGAGTQQGLGLFPFLHCLCSKAFSKSGQVTFGNFNSTLRKKREKNHSPQFYTFSGVVKVSSGQDTPHALNGAVLVSAWLACILSLVHISVAHPGICDRIDTQASIWIGD